MTYFKEEQWLIFIITDSIDMFILCVVMCQSESLVVCDVDEELVERLRKFRLRKETNNAAIISECSTQYIS